MDNFTVRFILGVSDRDDTHLFTEIIAYYEQYGYSFRQNEWVLDNFHQTHKINLIAVNPKKKEVLIYVVKEN